MGQVLARDCFDGAGDDLEEMMAGSDGTRESKVLSLHALLPLVLEFVGTGVDLARIARVNRAWNSAARKIFSRRALLVIAGSWTSADVHVYDRSRNALLPATPSELALPEAGPLDWIVSLPTCLVALASRQGLLRFGFAVDERRWKPITTTTTTTLGYDPIGSVVGVADDEEILISGGLGPERPRQGVRKVIKLNTSTGQLTHLPEMPSIHQLAAGGFLQFRPSERRFVVAGGRAESETTSLCHSWSETTGQWSQLPSMPEPRSSLSSTVWKNKLIVVVGAAREPSRKIWAFDTGANEWSCLPELAETSQFIQLDVLNDRLIVVFSEYNGTSRIYELAHEQAECWTKLTDLPVNCAGSAITVIPALALNNL